MKKSKIAKILISCVCVVALLCGAFFVWSVGTAYKPTAEALEIINEADGCTVTKESFGYFIDGEGTEKALIFYPGARVDCRSYMPLLIKLAEEGFDCFLIKMPCNMAFFSMNAADKVMEKYFYDEWIIGGHSLGGAMAASYASKNLEKLSALLLLAAYPTSELKADNFKVLSVYGSEDKIINREKLEAGRSFMPQIHSEVCIYGGNHAWFGCYGEQKGDGTAYINPQEQWNRTVEVVKSFL